LPEGTEVDDQEQGQGGLEELRAFESIRASLKPVHSGQWAVFFDSRVLVFRETFQEAVGEATRLVPDGRALIVPVDEEDAPEEPAVHRMSNDEVG